MNTNYGLPCDAYEEGCFEDEWNGISPLEVEDNVLPVRMPHDFTMLCRVVSPEWDNDCPF